MTKCEWCFNNVCEYTSSYEEQVENESFWECDGTQDEQYECGIFELMLLEDFGID